MTARGSVCAETVAILAATLGREKAFPVLNRLFGASYLEHVVNDTRFRVSPLSFFQVNTEQAGNLVNAVFEAAGWYSF